MPARSTSTDTTSRSSRPIRAIGTYTIPVQVVSGVVAEVKTIVSPLLDERSWASPGPRTTPRQRDGRARPAAPEPRGRGDAARCAHGHSGNVAEALGIVMAEEDFYREGHRLIFQAMLDLFNSGQPIEPLTVIEQLTKSGTLETAGGKGGVLDIWSRRRTSPPATAPTPRSSTTRPPSGACCASARRSRESSRNATGETDEMVQRAEDLVYGLSQESVRGDFVVAQQLVNATSTDSSPAAERGVEITGPADGLRRPGQDDRRSAPGQPRRRRRAAQHGQDRARAREWRRTPPDDGKTVAIFSIEMCGDGNHRPPAVLVAMVDGSRLRTGRLSQDDWPRIGQAADRFAQGEALHRRLRGRDRRRDAHQGAQAQEPAMGSTW